jgi:hypothetical protein
MGHREFLLCDNKLAQITSAVGSATRECVRRKAASFKSLYLKRPFTAHRNNRSLLLGASDTALGLLGTDLSDRIDKQMFSERGNQ